MKDRYQLYSNGYQQQVVGQPGNRPVAVRGKLSDLAVFVTMVVQSGFEWYVLDKKLNPTAGEKFRDKTNDVWVERETVFRVCRLNADPCPCCDSFGADHNFGLFCIAERKA